MTSFEGTCDNEMDSADSVQSEVREMLLILCQFIPIRHVWAMAVVPFLKFTSFEIKCIQALLGDLAHPQAGISIFAKKTGRNRSERRHSCYVS